MEAKGPPLAAPCVPAAYAFNRAFTAGHPETGGANGSEPERYAQGAGEYGSAPGVTFIQGTAIVVDSADKLFPAVGAGNLRAWSDGEAAGHQGLAN